mmetsp:Transcript_20368/g.51809  ORF Transcript_20368/g.51809 Transcript_20368/m.51809 type:complete len:101 (+) Transcript_20368:176-478(+)
MQHNSDSTDVPELRMFPTVYEAIADIQLNLTVLAPFLSLFLDFIAPFLVGDESAARMVLLPLSTRMALSVSALSTRIVLLPFELFEAFFVPPFLFITALM